MNNKILNRSKEISSEIIKNRRIIHEIAEIGFNLEKTINHVQGELLSYGIESTIIGNSGLTFTLGQGEKTFLLRGDMDALPMKEETEEDFSAKNGNCHACGHDIHTATLLGAAKILKEIEPELKGKVKFMFQPAEEILAGANDMISAGILENPKVDAAFALHITVGVEDSESGVIYHKAKELTFSGDALTIKVKGKDAHGSTPYLGVDSIYIASKIVVGLKSLTQHFVPSDIPSVVLVGKINGGTAPNTVAGETIMEVSVRSKNREYREKLLREIKNISENIAIAYGGEAIVYHDYGMPPLYNDEDLDKDVSGYIKELFGENNIREISIFNGSEDFAMIAEKVPATLMLIGVGSKNQGYEYYLHHPSISVDEESIYKASAVYAYSAIRWLEDNSRTDQ